MTGNHRIELELGETQGIMGMTRHHSRGIVGKTVDHGRDSDILGTTRDYGRYQDIG